MRNRITIATFFALLVGLFAVSTASAASPSDRAPIPPPTDYWQDQGFILMAHQGGEWDFPPNTMFAYKSAMALGTDMIDMDAYVTQDGHIVLSHDLDANNNSEAPDDTPINEQTLAQLKALDFAFKWSPHDGSSTTPFKGVATGNVPPPYGFTAEDFQIPTFDEVLDEFPNTPINIELKAVDGVDELDTAAKMDEILGAHPGREEDVIINSFGQSMLEKMHAARPEHLAFGGSLDGTVDYISGEPIVPTPVAVEPPDQVKVIDNPDPQEDVWLRSVPVLKPWADHDGYKIFVWGSDHDPMQDTPGFYETLINEGADSYNTPDPIALAAYLCTAGIARPDGSARCNAQKAAVSKVAFGAKKGQIKAGKKTKVTIKVSAKNDGFTNKVKVYLKSSNKQVRLQKFIVLDLRPGKTVRKTVSVKATGKAKGTAKLTATVGKKKAYSVLKVKAKKGKTGSASGK
ncbi:MAG: hypothetical protein JJE13_05945 [Thermoleophilia bacterium]|nr:hypothetical protein [Thermoleophilia bacterium]